MQFVAEEQKHTLWWRQLRVLSTPEDAAPLFHVPKAARWLLRQVTRRPALFPAVFWVMLALEERSIDISRRCLQSVYTRVEPHYREVYRKHLEHEVSHVYLDCRLIERFYARCSPFVRRLNARFLRTALARFLLPPVRSAARVVHELIRVTPDLMPLKQTLLEQLRDVGEQPEYHAMMYSRQSTPIIFSLFDRFPEMHRMSRVLKSYTPHPA
jgi:hypothetical protein